MRRVATAFALLIVSVGAYALVGVAPATAAPARVLAIHVGPDLEVNPVSCPNLQRLGAAERSCLLE